MLRIVIPASEDYDSEREEFIRRKEQTIVLEHSLVSLSKWESQFKKPFLNQSSPMTEEEFLAYVKCMTMTQNVEESVYQHLTPKNVQDILAYIDDTMTATTITSADQVKKPNREILTAEVLYYYMIALNIPMECQKWHLNRLIMLIQVCAIRNDPNPKKMGKDTVLRSNAALNAKRKARLKTRG